MLSFLSTLQAQLEQLLDFFSWSSSSQSISKMDCNSKWSRLPKDLLEKIVTVLDTRIDVLRLRAVCSSWRSSLPLKKSLLPSKLPFPIVPNSIINRKRRGCFRPSTSTIYRFEPFADALASSGSGSSSKACLVRIEETEHGKLRLLHPLTGEIITKFPETFPKVLNLLDYRVFELCTAHTLTFDRLGDKSYIESEEWKYMHVHKVAVSSSPVFEAFVVVAIDAAGKLGILNSGDKGWTSVGGLDSESPSKFDDVIHHKGKFYAVDSNGRTISIDSNIEVTQVAAPMSGNEIGRYKHLVPRSSDMFLVDMHVEDRVIEMRYNLQYQSWRSMLHGPEEPYNFHVFQLKGGIWLRVPSVGDHMLFLPRDISLCFSTLELLKCEDSCIYFIAYSSFEGQEEKVRFVGVYNVRAKISQPLASLTDHSQFIWPPPTWLRPKSSST